MRSVPAGSFERFTDFPALWQAYRACRRGKSRQPAMAAFDLDADRHLIALHRVLREDRYRPAPCRLRVVRDPKTRLIAAPTIRDRVLHRALLDDIGPTYERGFIDHSYTGGPGRGPHRAVLQYLRWLRLYGYRMHLDIAGYFPSIRHDMLAALLNRRLRDRRTRDLLGQLLAAGGAVYQQPLARQVLGERAPVEPGRGLALGSYLSQWCGTFYLDGLDHFVKRELKVAGYLRYMDDMVLFGDDPATLERQRAAVAEWLARERGLALKAGCGTVTPTGQARVFLGYRVSRAGISPGRKLRRDFRRKVRAAAERGPEALQRTIAAYRGMLTF